MLRFEEARAVCRNMLGYRGYDFKEIDTARPVCLYSTRPLCVEFFFPSMRQDPFWNRGLLIYKQGSVDDFFMTNITWKRGERVIF